MEMAEHKIAERIDCNLLDIEIKDLAGDGPAVSTDEMGSIIARFIAEEK